MQDFGLKPLLRRVAAVTGTRDPPRRCRRRRSRRISPGPAPAPTKKYQNAAPVPTTPLPQDNAAVSLDEDGPDIKSPGRNPFSVAFLALQALETWPGAAEKHRSRTRCSPVGAAGDARTAILMSNAFRCPLCATRWLARQLLRRWRLSRRKRIPNAAGTPRHSLRNVAVAPELVVHVPTKTTGMRGSADLREAGLCTLCWTDVDPGYVPRDAPTSG